MVTGMKKILQNREEAGRLLAEKLTDYKNTNAIVIGIPHGGVCVASVISKALSLPLKVLPCLKVKHPSDHEKNIGSVSINNVCIHDCAYDIPQDYIYHQVALLKNVLQQEYSFYYGENELASLLYKTVIVVDDVLAHSDTMLACLKEIKKQQPLKLIVAVPVVSAEAARIVQAEVDNIIFLKMVPEVRSGKYYFADFPKIDNDKVKELLREANDNSGVLHA